MRARLALTLTQMRSAVAELAARAVATCSAADLSALGTLPAGPWAQSVREVASMPLLAGGGLAGAAPAAAAPFGGRGAPPHLLRPSGVAPPPRSEAAPRGRRGYAAAPDRDELIDQRLGALAREHEALQRQLHGAFTARQNQELAASSLQQSACIHRSTARPITPPAGDHAHNLYAPADGSIAPSSERYQQLSRRAGLLQVVADGATDIGRLKKEVRHCKNV